nr:uncharacterized protein LOC127342138 [Lolium perenne]
MRPCCLQRARRPRASSSSSCSARATLSSAASSTFSARASPLVQGVDERFHAAAADGELLLEVEPRGANLMGGSKAGCNRWRLCTMEKQIAELNFGPDGIPSLVVDLKLSKPVVDLTRTTGRSKSGSDE